MGRNTYTDAAKATTRQYGIKLGAFCSAIKAKYTQTPCGIILPLKLTDKVRWDINKTI